MQIEINELVSSIAAVDHRQLLSPEIVRRLVQEVLRVIDERDAYRRRVAAERKVTSGVRDEQEGEA